MAAPDMEVIKEIPGYKVILKAVLKSQIQQLVEQLARSTDEESVILTASVADGTLCHLGSDSGKVFLEDHEDIKSQFLGFCLKRHHKQKQDKDRQEAQEKEEALARSMAPTTPPRYGGMGPRPGYMPQRSVRYSAPHPMSLTRASPNANLRSPVVRHHPYQMNRPPRPRLSLDQQQWTAGPVPVRIPEGQVIKIEPDDESNESSDKVQASIGAETSQPSSPSNKPTTPLHSQGPGASDNDDEKSESSTSTLPNEQLDSKFSENIPAAGLSLDSDLSNLIKASTSETDPNVSQSSDTQDSNSAPQTSVQLDPNVGVKLEAVTDVEMDLEITGVELGQRPTQEPMGSPNWMPNISMQGASGSSADMSGYSGGTSYQMALQNRVNSPDQIWGKRDLTLRCSDCGATFKFRSQLEIHRRIHTGVKPYICQVCNKRFAQKNNLKSHMTVHYQL